MSLHVNDMSLVHILERSSVGIGMLCMFSIIAYYLYMSLGYFRYLLICLSYNIICFIVIDNGYLSSAP